MKNHSNDPSDRWDSWREEIIGLGSKSYKKNYYQVLQKKITELKSSEHKFHTFFDFINDALIIHSLDDGRILDVNRRTEQLFGLSKEDILEKPIGSLSLGVTPYSQQEAMEWMRKAASEGNQFFEWIARDSQDRLFWIEVNMTVTSLDEEEVVIVSARDIDQRKKNELELEKYRKDLEKIVEERTREITAANDKLQSALKDLKDTQFQIIQVEKMASLGLLTAGIAHEINNPINFVASAIPGLKKDVDILKNTIELYRQDHPIKDTDRQKLEINLSEIDNNHVFQEIDELFHGLDVGVNRSRDIINSLKSYTNLESRDKEHDQLTENIELAIKILKSHIPSDLYLKRDFRYKGSIYCYPGPLNQVFINLISNAIDSILESSKAHSGIIQIKTYETDINGQSHIVIEVLDNGHGVPENNLDKIFDPFFSTKEQGHGTGLGLSVCQRIISDHGGVIAVNNIDQGCRFKVTLPV